VEVRVRGGGELPAYASEGAAGADVCSSETVLLSPGERAAVRTGLQLEIPVGHVGLIWPRSGLAVGQGIDTLAGVVDCDYRGELRIVLINHGEETLVIQAGDRIAQLLIQKVDRVSFLRTETLAPSDRGEAGFGSSGR
jgi:dUTP pyrophosphatase